MKRKSQITFKLFEAHHKKKRTRRERQIWLLCDLLQVCGAQKCVILRKQRTRLSLSVCFGPFLCSDGTHVCTGIGAEYPCGDLFVLVLATMTATVVSWNAPG